MTNDHFARHSLVHQHGELTKENVKLRARIAELEAENKRLGILHENYKAAVARAAYLGEKK